MVKLILMIVAAIYCIPALSYTDTYLGADGVRAQVFTKDFNSAGGTQNCTQSGCHSGGSPEGGILWGNYSSGTFSGAFASASAGRSRVSLGTMPPGPSPNVINISGRQAEFVARLDAWIAAGRPNDTPVISSVSESNITNTSARINATINPNSSGTPTVSPFQNQYVFHWGTTTSYGTTFTGNASTGLTGTARNSGANVSGLSCNTQYFYQVVATNGGASATAYEGGGTQGNSFFTTSACSNPIITQGGSTAAATESFSVGKSGPLTNVDFVLAATDVDTTSTLDWDLMTAATLGSATVSGTNTATPTISYTAPASAVGSPDTFVVRVTDESGGTDTVTVSVTITDTPPTITNATQPESITVTEDSSDSSLSLTATDPDLDTLTWSVFTAPSNGVVTTPLGTGSPKSITYTPNADVDTSDTFVIRVSDGSGNDDITVNVAITAQPDQVEAFDDLAYEVNVNSSNNALNVLANDTDKDTGDTKEVISVTTPSNGGAASINGASPGNNILFTPGSNITTPSTFTYTVEDSDGLTDSATVTVSFPDTDADGVIDYLDNCAATPNAGQEDFDGDQIINVNTTTDPGGNVGGDACDLDDDNDSLLDTYELSIGLNPFDPSDAPDTSTKTINATGYLTEITLSPPSPLAFAVVNTPITPVTDCAVRLTAYSQTPAPQRPGSHTIYWSSCDAGDNVISIAQDVDIVPLASLSPDQVLAEGSTATVKVNLNGTPPAYNATFGYTISGVSAADYGAITGDFSISSGTEGQISFPITSGDGAEGNETLTVTLTSATNAVLASDVTHNVTIIETNAPPSGSLSIDTSLRLFSDSAATTVTADVVDPNGDALTYDWNVATSPEVLAATSTNPSPNQLRFLPSGITTAGPHLVSVDVYESGVKAMTLSLVLNIATTAGAIADADADGIPDGSDTINSTNDPHLIQNQTTVAGATYIVETDPGLTLHMGSTAIASGKTGIIVYAADIANNGDTSGNAPLNPVDTFNNVGGIYDFTVSGLTQGESANIVIPLETGIPVGAVYRKFNPGLGWFTFVENSNNAVKSAAGNLGVCPAPGSNLYAPGLTPAHNCVQLTIEDGGPNDADAEANGVIKDPGGIGIVLSDPAAPTVSGGGRIHPMIIMLLLFLMATQIRRQYLGLKNQRQ